jgi:uncharacterized protein YecE (DUF72 family)
LPGPELRIGTSGWVYRHWQGSFYPPGLDAEDQLRFFARHFDTVEVNNSFYRLPDQAVFTRWAQRTPADFLFAVKASRYLTHMKRLKDPAEPLDRLLHRASGLGDKLGPILFQFPKNFERNQERLDGLLELLGRRPKRRYTFEFRHQSWLVDEVYRGLAGVGAALCLPVGMSLPVDVRLTAPWTYIRMHRGRRSIGFSDAELQAWADHARGFLAEGADVYMYFNNDTGGHALEDARRMSELLAAGHQGGRSMATKTRTRSGGLSAGKRNSMPEDKFAFPKERKEPLNDARHVRNAISRFDQVEDVSDSERDAAWRRIKAAAKKYGVEVSESSWRELGTGSRGRRR